MQKTFIKYIVFIITAAIGVILFINFLFNLHLLESQQFDTFFEKTEQMILTLENNRTELLLMRESLDEDYLTRAKAAAYVLDRQENLSMDVEEMQYLADLLNVDELHIIDENGIIVSASVSKYVGFDMAAHEQTRPFLELLENDHEDAYLIQEAQPNAAENKIMQYVGVARKSQVGVVEVGFTPTRQMAAQSRNTYEYIFSKFPTDIGEELFVVDLSTQDILGHSAGLDQDFSADCYQLSALLGCTEGAYRKNQKGNAMYVVSRYYKDVLLCAALPKSVILERLWKNMAVTFAYLLFVEIMVILLLNYLVKQKVINGIHNVLWDLESIAHGNLDTKVAVGGNREFEALSEGINGMVKSIVDLSNRISAIIELSGIPLAAFEYQRGSNHVFVTSGLKDLLGLSESKAAELYRDCALFDQYIHSIINTPLKGEENVYQIEENKYLHIYLSESADGYLGVLTDVSKEIQQKEKLQYKNSHDPLTGLCNLDCFKELSAEILAKMPSGNTAAMVMIDLDSFKSINDTYGHDVGDHYLKTFSEIMKSMPQEHFLPARRSGDEFCMLIFGCGSREQVIDFLDFFYKTLGKRTVVLSPAHTKKISASCGFALADSAQNSIAELLSRADQALYQVKRGVKGTYGEYQKT